MRHHGTLKSTPPHMNYVLAETSESFKLSSATITYKSLKKKHLLHLYPPEIRTNHQACLSGTKQSNIEKAGEIARIVKVSIAPIDMEAVRTTDPMFILR